jgi:hypothetical protein
MALEAVARLEPFAPIAAGFDPTVVLEPVPVVELLELLVAAP